MKKQFAVLMFLAAVAVSLMVLNSRSSGAPSFNPADYPYANMSFFHPTTLKAATCANSAQEALKRSGYSRIGSSKPGNSLFGVQGSCLAGIGWDADRQVYYFVVAGPDKETVNSYHDTLKNNAKDLFEK